MAVETKPATRLWTVGAVLTWTAQWFARHGIASARLDAEVLLAHVLGVDRVHLYVDYHRPLTPEERAAYRHIVQRRVRGEPVAYLVGQREFWSLPLRVTPAVLIPRPETEALVEAVAAAMRPLAAPRIADVGTGSGAIAVALAVELPRARISATDVSAEALAVARDNAERHGVADRIAFYRGSLLEPVRPSWGSFDAVVSNPPYVPTAALATLPREVRDHEPRAALDGGPDGLRVIAPLVDQATRAVRPGGIVAIETGGAEQVARVVAWLEATGRVAHTQVLRDAAGDERIAWGVAAERGP